MTELPRALALSFAQLGDRRILRVLGKVVLVTLALFALLGVAAVYGMGWLLARYEFGWAQEAGALLGILLTVIGGWLLFRIVALAVMQFFADEVVRAVELRHYPDQAGRMRDLPLAREIRASLRGTGRALLANAIAAPFALLLLFTGIGPAILFGLVNAVLLGRELQDMVWLRHPAHSEGAQPIAATTRFALGGVVALGLLVPFAGLVAPVIGAASATHLVHRGASRLSR